VDRGIEPPQGRTERITFTTWFADTEPIELSGEHFVLAVPNDFTRTWIEDHFLDLIHAAIREAVGSTAPSGSRCASSTNPRSRRLRRRPASAKGLNPKYTFDLFVIGSSNRFAHAAALAVAEAPAQAYNPLFIYGGTGLGKTHLLQAIASYIGEHSRNLSARYVTSEIFMNDFINSLRDKRIEGFKQRYRHYDVLLIDDIQFFEHKERIQEEFFHTFNSLYEAGRQIVISSDRPPRAIATLEARLRSRFEWGLITDIQAPDLETRIAILRKKVKTDAIHVPGLAGAHVHREPHLDEHPRARGRAHRVVAFSSLTGRPMTVELAQEVLKDVFPQGELPEVSVERIQETVVERFGISMQELTGDRRSQQIVYPRQVAMYLCRELTDSSLPKIGKKFGGRDHTRSSTRRPRSRS
jgi:chromosomal replication initiator protein